MSLFGAAPLPLTTTSTAMSSTTSYKHQLRYALSGLASRDLESTSVAAARAVLRELRGGHSRGALKVALQEVLTGSDGAPKHAARLRLQLAEFAVLECFEQAELSALLPLLTKQVRDVCAAATCACRRCASVVQQQPGSHTPPHTSPAVLTLHTTQANAVLAAHRSDAAVINSLAALLSSCLARLLHDPRGSYAAMHAYETRGSSSSPEPPLQTPTADQLCEALLFPVVKATFRCVMGAGGCHTYTLGCTRLAANNPREPAHTTQRPRVPRVTCHCRDPEQMRVSAGSVVLCGMFEVLRAHTRDQPVALDCVQRCLALMLQLMGHSSSAQRAPGVLLPVCACVEVLGLGLDKECTSRLLSLCLKAAVVKEPWQVG
jgi:hypothetical protein